MSQNGASPLLKGVGLKKTYGRGSKTLPVLKGIDLEIQAGEMAVIVGPSGAGKSTLLHILGGLDRPTEGKVRFQDKELYAMRDKELARVRNRLFGFIFQFYHLVPELTALENVMLPAWIDNSGRASRRISERAQQLLDQVGLKDRVSHRPAELSGGEQQRVAIARALINNPQVVFCDEPTGNLDSENGANILRLLGRFHKEQGTAFIIVTHEPALTQVAGRVISLKDGKLWA